MKYVNLRKRVQHSCDIESIPENPSLFSIGLICVSVLLLLQSTSWNESWCCRRVLEQIPAETGRGEGTQGHQDRSATRGKYSFDSPQKGSWYDVNIDIEKEIGLAGHCVFPPWGEFWEFAMNRQCSEIHKKRTKGHYVRIVFSARQCSLQCQLLVKWLTIKDSCLYMYAMITKNHVRRFTCR